MILKTERLLLRPWSEDDAEALYEYAKDPRIGPAAGWPCHKSAAESRESIRGVLSAPETYAVCRREDEKLIGCIALKLRGHTDMTDRDDECELGYWLGVPFWGRGLMAEAAEALLRRAFEELSMTTVWCGYYDGNERSRRVQEKLGFIYDHTCPDVPVPLMGETRIGHTNRMTREDYELGIGRRGC